MGLVQALQGVQLAAMDPVSRRRLLEDEMVKAKRAREDAQRELERIKALVPHAARAGVPVQEIAFFTGLSRPTVYKLLDGAGVAPARASDEDDED